MGSTEKHRLSWMPPHAPYMPVASIGLLRVVGQQDPGVTLGWQPGERWRRPSLVLRSALALEDVADAIETAPWPELATLPWGDKMGQAIRPTLAQHAKEATDEFAAVKKWRSLAGLDQAMAATTPDPSQRAANEHVAALLTDAVVDDGRLPGRNRLLRGVKADLSGVAKPPKCRPGELFRELREGPTWRPGSSGLALGFAPQVQTFGGTTGPEPSAVGAFSNLLYRLCWNGIAAMPPFGVRRGRWPAVGGPLFSAGDTLSWPIWEMPLAERALVILFGLDEVHQPEPNSPTLRAHDISAVFRSTSRKINTMISVFGWGERVA